MCPNDGLSIEDACRHLYNEIIRTSNRFLHNCKFFPLDILRGEEPSYAELARGMKFLAVIINTLAVDFDPMWGQQASEYCELMARIGVAITQDDKVALATCVGELERKPGVAQ
jgi:hypothetical protein